MDEQAILEGYKVACKMALGYTKEPLLLDRLIDKGKDAVVACYAKWDHQRPFIKYCRRRIRGAMQDYFRAIDPLTRRQRERIKKGLEVLAIPNKELISIQLEILQRLATGMTPSTVGRDIDRTPDDIRYHIKRIASKFDMSGASVTGIVMEAVKRGIIQIERANHV